MSQNAGPNGFSRQKQCELPGTINMIDTKDFVRIPGLYRLWDLQFVVNERQEFRVHYAETTEDGTPLFAVYNCDAFETGRRK